METIKRNYSKIIYIVLYVVLGIGLVSYTYKWFKNLKGFESKTFAVMFCLLILLMAITVFILFKFNKDSICKQFLIIALIWGSVFVLINPPYYVPDESVHVYRSYDLAKGRLFFKGSKDSMMLPSGIIEHDSAVWKDAVPGGFKEYLKDMKIPLNKNDLISYDASATAAYSSIAYIPQAIGVFIGDLLNLPSHFVLILGRFANLFAWIALCYLALKFIPIKKELLFMLMFMPIGVQQAASFSPDALLNSSSFLLIAYILYLKFQKDDVGYKDYLIILALTLIIGAIKLPYILISGLVVLIPNKKMTFKLFSKVLAILMVLVVNLGVFAMWKHMSKPIPKEVKVITVLEEDIANGEQVEVASNVSEEISTKDMIIDIATKPHVFLSKVIDTVKDQWEFYKYSMTTNFGWFKLLGPEDFMNVLILIILLFAIKGDDNGYKLNLVDKGVLLLMTIGMYLILCLVSFKWQGVPLRNIVVFTGLQGRYFFPFIIGILLSVQNTRLKVKVNEFWVNSFRNLYVCWILAFSTILIFNGYFIFR